MNDSNFIFATHLVNEILAENHHFKPHPDIKAKLQTLHSENAMTVLDLTPFKTSPSSVNAESFFKDVKTADDLINVFNNVKKQYKFEMDLPSVKEKINAYSTKFSQTILQSANRLTDSQIILVANFVKNLDIYCAIKSIESLLNSAADIALLEVANKNNWQVHFDHLAIRCGSETDNDAKFIANFLMKEHGYVSSHVKEEAHYQFPDGWNAYPLYKILDNGQVLRLFVDQSDITDKNQIIQHWNRVYGYTAHHLALRATEIKDGKKHEIPLQVVMNALQSHGVTILTPTGEHTQGFLLQVFTKPELNEKVPESILNDLRQKGHNLEKTIKNGKLLEIVSRKEMSTAMAIELFHLYGLDFDINNPLHSAPCYTYFLPAQAAHVIKTSQTI